MPRIKRSELWLIDAVAFGGKYLTVSKSQLYRSLLCGCTFTRMPNIWMVLAWIVNCTSTQKDTPPAATIVGCLESPPLVDLYILYYFLGL
jgi:hypothetical protein